MTNSRKFRGFAALERPDGALIWGTFRPSEADARAVYERWNPPIDGAPRGQIVQVEIKIFDKKAPHDL